MSDRNPHISGRYTIIAALIGAITTISVVFINHYLSSSSLDKKEEPKEIINAEVSNSKEEKKEERIESVKYFYEDKYKKNWNRLRDKCFFEESKICYEVTIPENAFLAVRNNSNFVDAKKLTKEEYDEETLMLYLKNGLRVYTFDYVETHTPMIYLPFEGKCLGGYIAKELNGEPTLKLVCDKHILHTHHDSGEGDGKMPENFKPEMVSDDEEY